MQTFGQLFIKYHLLILKNGMFQIHINFLIGTLQKNPYIRHLEKEKWIFHATEMKTFFGKFVVYSNVHTFAKYEIFWENYPLKLAITSVIWLESHESSYSIARFVKTF